MGETGDGWGSRSEPATTNGQDDTETPIVDDIEAAEAALSSLSADAPDRYKKLEDLACAIVTKHESVKSDSAEELYQALNYANQALDLVPPNHVHDQFDLSEPTNSSVEDSFRNEGKVYDTLRRIYYSLYIATGGAKYLDEAIAYGGKSVEYMEAHRNDYPTWIGKVVAGQRLDAVSGLFKLRFSDPDSNIGGIEEDLDKALLLKGRAADETPTVQESYTRFGLFCDLLVFKAGVRDDVKYIDAALSMRAQRPRKVLDLTDEDGPFAMNNYSEYSKLLSRRWQMTDADEDFDKLIEESREMVEHNIQGEDPREYITDPYETKDVLRLCAEDMASTTISESDGKWADHIPTLNTAIALLTELLNMIPMDTKEELDERHEPLIQATRLLDRRWNLTKDPRDGHALDDMNVHGAQHNASRDAASAEENIVSMTQWSSHGESAGMGKDLKFWAFDPPSLPIGRPRLLFLDPVCAENWVRTRNDDGTVELGATEKDVDVWEFCQKMEKTAAEKKGDTVDGAKREDGEDGEDGGGERKYGVDSETGAGEDRAGDVDKKDELDDKAKRADGSIKEFG